MGTDGGFQGREDGQRDGSKGRGAWWGIRLCLLGSITRLCSVPGSGTCGDVLGEERGRQLPEVLFLCRVRRDVEHDPPPAPSIPGNLPCAGKTILMSQCQSKLHPSVVK